MSTFWIVYLVMVVFMCCATTTILWCESREAGFVTVRFTLKLLAFTFIPVLNIIGVCCVIALLFAQYAVSLRRYM